MARRKLKDWFDKDLAMTLAEKIQKVFPDFDSKRFVQTVEDGVRGLELKARVERIADALRDELPKDYPRALEILTAILGPENLKETGMFTEGYWIMPIAKYVEKYGIRHYSKSIEAIEEITKRHTGEYCVRPFIEKYPQKTLAVMRSWSKNENVHVRRLSSEGARPRLPWAGKLDVFVADPAPVLEILENLKDDPSRFVQKSVANAMNDILKDNERIGMETLKRWSRDAGRIRRWIIRRALRNLIKKGNAEAVGLLEALDAGGALSPRNQR
ncbi:3-methyladenine DNA glycosylase [Candidatus Desulfarcum epimagneticum]|uniref:3-methyladenine DNA glycosylase n=1 Tax=uncultured Desulfobacteraceae bacterium TaxID=218296 RepID=A0A484HRB6_9BACT|nr:3-methyladenine DNA glycosylase [uncultured Desulfobacteraceae bacterium]